MSVQLDHAGLMDRVYRLQRRFGFYDATRKYYLVGRDNMLEGLAVPPGQAVLEIGCGTGRNLVRAGRLYPTARLFGMDISREMLAAAGQATRAAGFAGRVQLARADAAEFDAQESFGRASFDRVYISYAISMIPQWQKSIHTAMHMLAPGGELHIVDFGDLGARPRWQRRALYTWLRWYHVTPRNTLFGVCEDIARANDCMLEQRRLYGGFAWIAVLRKPDRLLKPATSEHERRSAAA